jgi:hypothetical protein
MVNEVANKLLVTIIYPRIKVKSNSTLFTLTIRV